MSYCNAEYAMFKVLKGLRGNGNICMLMRVVTDFNVFDIGILQIFVLFFNSCLPKSPFRSRSVQLLFTNITHIFNIRLSAYDFCMPASLIFNLTNDNLLATVQHKLSIQLKFNVLRSVIITDLFQHCLRLLTRSNMLRSSFWSLLATFLWFSVFCVCFSHCTKCKNK